MVQALDNDSENPITNCYTIPKCLKPFTMAELAGSEITYTCQKCRQCTDCKNYEHACALTIEDEEEQALLEGCVYVYIEKRVTS